jgi:glycosyltransferase involved in cell wall biosynthesis
MGGQVYIVIPAFNEVKSIAKVARDLKAGGYKNIVVVDDGSRDMTYSVAKKAGVFVLRHIVNRGQGAALRTGIDYALLKGADIIVTFDADGQHSVGDLKAMIAPVAKNEVDITLGSRFLGKKSNVSFCKAMMLKGGALIFRIMYGISLTDSHNGLRAMSAKAARAIDLSSDGMEHASEIPEKIAKKHIRFKEIPVTIKYTEYSAADGQSSLAAFKILFRMIMRWFMR